jgi:heme/copper-type cytochrome/quinol oxidase subunit 2
MQLNEACDLQNISAIALVSIVRNYKIIDIWLMSVFFIVVSHAMLSVILCEGVQFVLCRRESSCPAGNSHFSGTTLFQIFLGPFPELLHVFLAALLFYGLSKGGLSTNRQTCSHYGS